MWNELLEQVREEIAETAEETRVYFSASYQRYLDTLNFLGSAPPGKLLDVGCSPGHLAMALTLAGFEVTGVDCHPGYPERYMPAAWREKLHIQFVDMEHSNLPYEDNSFDYITCCEMMEHIAIRPPLEILNELYRVLRPGGIFLLSTPQVANLSHALALWEGHNVFWKEELFYGGLDRHNREYTFEEMVALFSHTKFTPVKYRLTTCDANWNSTTYELTAHLLARYKNRRHRIPTELESKAQWAEKYVELFLRKEGQKQFDPSLPFFNNTILVKAGKKRDGMS